MLKTAALLFLSALFIHPRLVAADNYWQQFVHYSIDANLLPAERAVIADETITYVNNSPDTLQKIYLHLYPNAFRDNASLRSREARRYYEQLVKRPEDAGYINIESFRIVTPKSSGRGSANSNPLSAFEVDDTILSADLPEPLVPGDTLILELSFYHKVRKHKGRAGYRAFQYDMAQWYPKVCVYDENGWDNEPFHYIGEFYGEFGIFDVTITTPFEYVVAATGVVMAGDPGWKIVEIDSSLAEEEWQDKLAQIRERMRAGSAQGELRTVRFRAENVHDFAWAASPDFLYEYREWQGIAIHVLYRSRARHRWRNRVAGRAAAALAWLSDKFGPYPYPQVTIIHGLLRGGMEHPMLVLNSSERESLILHEIGHIYFYGILANNERKEAWLDEGFTTFQTRWYLEEKYGDAGFDSDLILHRANWLQRKRPFRTRAEQSRDALLAFVTSGHDEPLSRQAADYAEPISYRTNAYDKGAFFFETLRYVVGDSTFTEICRTYFERWKFKHVNEVRFRQIANEVSGSNLDWLFKQWMHTTPKIDYALEKVEKRKTESGWQTEITILRNENGTLPVEVEVTTRSGVKQTQRWDGFDRMGKVTFLTQDKPVRTVLDPDDKILDLFPPNNRPLKLRLLFDYPGMSYSPRDAYLLRWRPSAWYNDVDGIRIGGRLKGSYGRQRNAEAGLWLGTESGVVDGLLKYSNPIRTLGTGTTGTLGLQKLEGRLEIDGHLSFVKSRYLQQPPRHRFQVGFNHARLLDNGDGYVLQEFDQKNDTTLAVWEKGDVNKLYFRYAINQRGLTWFSLLNLGLDTVQEDWASDFTFTSLFGELKLLFRGARQAFSLRLFGQHIGNSDDAPIQEMIFLGGANPRQRFDRFYLRSRGGLPAELHYHLPGGPNLRGYYNNPLVVDQALSMNIEAQRELGNRFLGRKLAPLLGSVTIAAFADLASVEFPDSRQDTFADAGLGLRFRNILPDNWYTIFTGGRDLTIRLDFPIWVSRPLPDEKELRFRWVFGFEQAL